MQIYQHTINKAIETTGIGLHNGKSVKLSLRPAPINTGILFTRTDLQPPVTIPALAKYVTDTQLATSIGFNHAKIATIEHLMSACMGLGIDNLFIDVNDAELPIMDGSAAAFVDLIKQAGISEQSALRKYLCIKKPISITEGEENTDNFKAAAFSPYNGFRVDLTIAYQHPAFSNMRLHYIKDIDTQCYEKELCTARTYGFKSDYQWLRDNNLALGASLENAVVIGDNGVLNEEGLRYPDECVRHKVLDALGDIYLLGYPVLGEFTAYRPGHGINYRLIKSLLQQPEKWSIENLPLQLNTSRTTKNALHDKAMEK